MADGADDTKSEMSPDPGAGPTGQGISSEALGEDLAQINADFIRDFGQEAADAFYDAVEAGGPAVALQRAWNDRARADALTEFGALTTAQLAESGNIGATASIAIVERWLEDGLVFAVETPEGLAFPTFQFLEGEPRPVIGRVLIALAGELRGWEILLWFTGSNGHLGGARPVDRLLHAPDEVVAAAAYQAALSED